MLVISRRTTWLSRRRRRRLSRALDCRPLRWPSGGRTCCSNKKSPMFVFQFLPAVLSAAVEAVQAKLFRRRRRRREPFDRPGFDGDGDGSRLSASSSTRRRIESARRQSSSNFLAAKKTSPVEVRRSLVCLLVPAAAAISRAATHQPGFGAQWGSRAPRTQQILARFPRVPCRGFR